MEIPHADPDLWVEVTHADVSYHLYVPDRHTDYIQGRVWETSRPYEEEMLADMADRLQQNDVVLDVGANVGNHAIFLASVAQCMVHAIEPSEHLVSAIRQSVARNSLMDRILVHQFGAARDSGDGGLVTDDPTNLGGQRVVADTSDAGEPIVLRTVDSLRLERVNAIKIDVEGMELDVLAGARETISRSHPLIYVEALNISSFEEVARELEYVGYVYLETFNASPTHLFVHQTALDSYSMQRRLHRVARGVYEHRDESARLREALNSANLRYRNLVGQFESLRADVVGRGSRPAEEIERLQAMVKTLQSTVSRLGEANARLERETVRLSRDTAEARSDLARSEQFRRIAERDLELLDDDHHRMLESMGRALETFAQERSAGDRVHAEAQARQELVKHDFEVLRDHIASQDETIKELKSWSTDTITQLTAELNANRTDLKRCNDQLARMRRARDNAKQQLEVTRLSLNEVKAEARANNDKLIELKESTTFALGIAARDATRSVGGLLRLLPSIGRILKVRRERGSHDG